MPRSPDHLQQPRCVILHVLDFADIRAQLITMYAVLDLLLTPGICGNRSCCRRSTVDADAINGESVRDGEDLAQDAPPVQLTPVRAGSLKGVGVGAVRGDFCGRGTWCYTHSAVERRKERCLRAEEVGGRQARAVCQVLRQSREREGAIKIPETAQPD